MKTWFAFLFCVAFCQTAAAGLIQNGSFEQTKVPDRSWRWFTSDKVLGWQGSNIEIWHRLNNFSAYEGKQHAELNAHGAKGPFSIFQTFATELGQAYAVSFAYAARTNNSEAFVFDVLDQQDISIYSQLLDQHTVKNWSLFNTSFIATSAYTTIRFTTVNKGSYGNFLDDINVTSLNRRNITLSRVNNVPESSPLLALVVLVLVFSSRVSSKNS